MKIEVLKEFIKKTVQQEVRSVLKQELKKQLAEILLKEDSVTVKKSKDTELEDMLENIDDQDTTLEDNSPPPAPVKKFVKYSNNPMLNEILNQTTGGIPQEGGMVSMMGGMGSIGSEVITETKVPENAPAPVKGVYSAMNRDYRSLMKAVNNKRGSK